MILLIGDAAGAVFVTFFEKVFLEFRDMKKSYVNGNRILQMLWLFRFYL